MYIVISKRYIGKLCLRWLAISFPARRNCVLISLTYQLLLLPVGEQFKSYVSSVIVRLRLSSAFVKIIKDATASVLLGDHPPALQQHHRPCLRLCFIPKSDSYHLKLRYVPVRLCRNRCVKRIVSHIADATCGLIRSISTHRLQEITSLN
jgi:hypothetical protein